MRRGVTNLLGLCGLQEVPSVCLGKSCVLIGVPPSPGSALMRNLSSIKAETGLADVRSVVAVFGGNLWGRSPSIGAGQTAGRVAAASSSPPGPLGALLGARMSLASPGHHPVLAEATILEPTRQVFRLITKKRPLWGIRMVVLQGKLPGATWNESFRKGSLTPAISSIELFVTIALQGQGVWLIGPLMSSDSGCKSQVKC